MATQLKNYRGQVITPKVTITQTLTSGVKCAEINGVPIFAPSSGNGSGGSGSGGSGGSGSGGSGGSSVTNKYKGLHANGAISNGEKIETPDVKVVKNCMLSAIVSGTIDSNGVEIGVGKGNLDFNDSASYGASFIITDTSLIYDGNTYAHGLTLSGEIVYVNLTTSTQASAKLEIINEYGDVYTKTITWRVYVGKAMVKNLCANDIVAKLTYYLMDISKPIWVFGDSYMSYFDSARWMYYCLQDNHDNFLLDAKGGEDATQGLADLKNILDNCETFPSVILWTHGMNAGGDVDGSINPNWMAATTELISICEEHGIELVFCTIPSLPNVDARHTKTALNNWVRNSGYRYVDVAKAMGDDDPSGNCRGWGTDNALLNKKSNGNPDVHPTARGAKMIYRQVLVDFPEIAIN